MIDFKDLKKEKVENFNNGEGYVTRYMFNDGRVKIAKMTLKKGASIGLHQHITSLEVIYVLSGVATSVVDGVKETVEKGNIIYCPKTKMHTIKNNGDKNLVILCVIPELEIE